jgi:competence protein ComEA
VSPIARAALVVLGLVVLALIGRSAIAGAGSGIGGPTAAPRNDAADASPLSTATTFLPAPAPDPLPGVQPAVHSPATADDPVFLNQATAEDLRRLPGIGPKKADAILALRHRMGRFRQVEDLLKVKGIGRGTLKRLRPLVKLDTSDAGPV